MGGIRCGDSRRRESGNSPALNLKRKISAVAPRENYFVLLTPYVYVGYFTVLDNFNFVSYIHKLVVFNP